MSNSMRKVMSFEIGDESMDENYARYTIHFDLRKVIATFLGFAILCLVLEFGLNPASVSAQKDFVKFHQTHPPIVSAYSYAHKCKSQTEENESRQKFVKNMTIEAWNAYKEHAWGQDNLKPHSRYGDIREIGGLTLIQSMSTLWTMKLKNEFNLGRQWIARKFDFANSDAHSYVFVAATEYMGSLLSCYALTKDDIFLEKANEVAKALEPAFNTKTGVPNKSIYPASSYHTQSNDVHLAEAGGEHIEFSYLAHLTQDFELSCKIENVRKHLLSMYRPNGLYMSDLYTDKSEWCSKTSSLFWPSNVFYQYLVKSYIQSNQRDAQAMEMYRDAIDAVERMKLIITAKSNLTYAREYYSRSQSYSTSMHQSGCALGAMFALSAHATEKALVSQGSVDITSRIAHYWKLAEDLTETCHHEAARTATGLPPKNMYFGDRNWKSSGGYDLTGDLAESYFVLWRLTHDEKYREYAWQLAQAIYKNCRTKNGGYTEVSNVHDEDSHSDHQPSHLLSTTLKYLYLTFSEDTLFSLDQWVFNRVGQPLPVWA